MSENDFITEETMVLFKDEVANWYCAYSAHTMKFTGKKTLFLCFCFSLLILFLFWAKSLTKQTLHDSPADIFSLFSLLRFEWLYKFKYINRNKKGKCEWFAVCCKIKNEEVSNKKTMVYYWPVNFPFYLDFI